MVDYSFLSTMYNNVDRLPLCLNSILAAVDGFDYELIIVDNYSTDGSFEILKHYSRVNANLKIFRCKCLRGLGRQIAFEHSKGKYVITIDMDTEYPSEKLRKFLSAHKQSKNNVFAIKTWDSFCIYPRHLIDDVGGWKNYNVSEDVDVLARIFLVKKAVFVPINLEFNEEYFEEQEEDKAYLGLLETFRREHRYAKGFKLIRRLVQNRIDFLCANAYTFKKIILHHRFLHMNLFASFFVCFQLIASKIINAVLGRPVTNVDSILTNSQFVFYNYVQTLVDPRDFDLKTECAPSFLDESFSFLSYLDADIGERLKQFLKSSTANGD